MSLTEIYKAEYWETYRLFEESCKKIEFLQGKEQSDEIKNAKRIIQSANDIVELLHLSCFTNNHNSGDEYRIHYYAWKMNFRVKIKEIENENKRKELFTTIQVKEECNDLLLKSENNVKKAGEYLHQAAIISDDTVTIGMDIVDTLEEQNKQIKSIRDRLGIMNESLTASMRVMRQISRKLLRSKIFMFCIIFMIIVVICVIIYLKFSVF